MLHRFAKQNMDIYIYWKQNTGYSLKYTGLGIVNAVSYLQNILENWGQKKSQTEWSVFIP